MMHGCAPRVPRELPSAYAARVHHSICSHASFGFLVRRVGILSDLLSANDAGLHLQLARKRSRAGNSGSTPCTAGACERTRTMSMDADQRMICVGHMADSVSDTHRSSDHIAAHTRYGSGL